MKPHKCPVCNGRGFVIHGFYGGDIELKDQKFETCRTCDGGGIVWEKRASDLVEGLKAIQEDFDKKLAKEEIKGGLVQPQCPNCTPKFKE